jgi:hypothetical protein
LNTHHRGPVQTISRMLNYLHNPSYLTTLYHIQASWVCIRTDSESVGKEGTPSQDYERNTWPELAKLAQEHPEAGVHFQGMQQDNFCTQEVG